jgi:predicted CopG family antitoxin
VAFKTLTIKEDVYKKLLSMKREDESFSDLFERLLKRDIAVLKSLRGSIEFKDKKKMIEEIYKKREEKR